MDANIVGLTPKELILFQFIKSWIKKLNWD